MGPPGWGDLEGSSRAGPYYFWEQYVWTPPYGFSAMWYHTTSDCVTVCLHSLDVATSRCCQEESSLAMSGSPTDFQCVWTAWTLPWKVTITWRLTMCGCPTVTASGFYHMWLVTLTPLSGISTQEPIAVSGTSPLKTRPPGLPCPHRSPHGLWEVLPEVAPTQMDGAVRGISRHRWP